jgi:hypothetical protein
MEKIVNKVKESGLISLDLATFKPNEHIEGIDIAPQLWQGLVLKEKNFRSWTKEFDWSYYENKAVYIYCSEDAIIPTWAYMLIGAQLMPYTDKFQIGSKEDLEKQLIKSNITKLKLDDFIDGRIIIKGCTDIASPEYAMVELVKKLQPVAKSIMYGEPCSTVPVFKRK